MNYSRFISYNIIGGIVWVAGLTLAGFYLVNIPFVRDNFKLISLGIIIISLLPIVFELVFAKKK